MKVKLRIDKGGKPSQTLTLRGPEAVIGRATGNAVRIPSNDVSRRHCQLCIRDDKVTVEDLGSLNGTYLNSKRVEGIREVFPGDRIRIGPVTFLVAFVPDTAKPGELDELELVDADAIDVSLESAPASKSEAPTKKQKPLPEKEAPDKEKPIRRSKGLPSESTATEADIGLAPVEQNRPAPPPEEDDLIPLTGEHPREATETNYVEFDQAWKVPEPTDLRDILHGLEYGEAIEEEEDEK